MEPKIGTLRIRLSIDEGGTQEIYDGKFSDVEELQNDVLSKVESGVWECYNIDVERAVPGEWERVASLGVSVHDSGLSGIYWSPEEFTNEGTRGVVQDVWDEAKEIADSLDVPAPRSTPRLIMNAGEIRDIWDHFKQDIPFPMRLADGTEIEVVAGDPSSGQIGKEHADLDEIYVRNAGL